MDIIIPPPAGHAHVACVRCGHVMAVPVTHLDPPPWCLHRGGAHSWGSAPGRRTPWGPWTRMICVTVRNRAVEEQLLEGLNAAMARHALAQEGL